MTCKHGEPGCVCTKCDLETIAAAQSKSKARIDRIVRFQRTRK